MTNEEIIVLAKSFMNKRNVDFLLPGEIGEINGDLVEVIFMNPFTLDPDSIVCPPDIRVLVNTKTLEMDWAVHV